jgi:type IV pilus assembly protein PilV
MALMEALVSILIFSFGVLGLIGLEASAVNFSVDAEDRNRAAVFANEIASNMWLNNSVNNAAITALIPTWNTAVANTAAAGLPNGTVTITTVAGTTRSADIVITWIPVNDKTAQTRSLSTRVILP